MISDISEEEKKAVDRMMEKASKDTNWIIAESIKIAKEGEVGPELSFNYILILKIRLDALISSFLEFSPKYRLDVEMLQRVVGDQFKKDLIERVREEKLNVY